MRISITTFALATSVWVSGIAAASDRAPTTARTTAPLEAAKNTPEMILWDGSLAVSFGEERLVLPRGLQPSMLVTRSGSVILQAQVPEKPFPSKRMTYFSAMSTRVSRDGGLSWTDVPLKPNDNG